MTREHAYQALAVAIPLIVAGVGGIAVLVQR